MKVKKPKCLKEIQITQNKFVKVNMDILQFSTGIEGTHIKVTPKSGSGVVVFVQNQNGDIYLHHAYHYASDIVHLECIRGFKDINEDSLHAAKRELQEEISYNYNLLSIPTFIGKIYPDTTIINGYANLYFMKVNVKNKLTQHKDKLEFLSNGEFYSINQLHTLIANGEIQDSFTLSAFALLKAKDLI